MSLRASILILEGNFVADIEGFGFHDDAGNQLDSFLAFEDKSLYLIWLPFIGVAAIATRDQAQGLSQLVGFFTAQAQRQIERGMSLN